MKTKPNKRSVTGVILKISVDKEIFSKFLKENQDIIQGLFDSGNKIKGLKEIELSYSVEDL